MKTINERLEHLQRIQDCIEQAKTYNTGDMLDLKRYADMWQWLGMDIRVKKQVEFRMQVIAKLKRFFAVKCMELAIEAASRTKSPLLTDMVIGGVHITDDMINEKK